MNICLKCSNIKYYEHFINVTMTMSSPIASPCNNKISKHFVKKIGSTKFESKEKYKHKEK